MPDDKKHLKLPHVAMIYAVSYNNVMGKNNSMPWHCPADFRFFKRTTLSQVVVMGRKTWESMGSKALPWRVNIVVTSQSDYKAEGALVVGNLYDAVTEGRKQLPEATVFIIGGKSLLEEAELIAGTVYVTTIGVNVEIDDTCVLGPQFSENYQYALEETEVFSGFEKQILSDGSDGHPSAVLRIYK